MNITSYDIEQFAHEAANSYLRDTKPLNDSILKIAQTHNLNYEQTSRIVEEANTQVYLNLFHKAASDSRYIEFPTANMKTIGEQLHERDKKAGLLYESKLNDYCIPPKSKYIPASKQVIENFDKLASITEEDKLTTSPALEKLQEMEKKAREEIYHGAFKELLYYIEKQAERLVHEARQDILQNDNAGNYVKLFNQALPKYPKVAEYLIEQLPESKEKSDKSKEAFVINEDHWFYKEARNLNNLLEAHQDSQNNKKLAHEKIAAWRNWALFGLGASLSLPAMMGYSAYKSQWNQIKSSPFNLNM